MTDSCPVLRLRLFLSVDMVGSTDFKASSGAEDEGKPYPKWVPLLKHFYASLPFLIKEKYEANHKPYFSEEECKNDYPHVWKYLGDEILFSVYVRNLTHLTLCLDAFFQALDEYGNYLERYEPKVDVKGCGWVAHFPVPNVTIANLPFGETSSTDETTFDKDTHYNKGHNQDYITEEQEKAADQKPHLYDFLGKDIDTGFRISKFAAPDLFAMTVELAWLLAESVHRKLMHKEIKFSFHNFQSLKGVIGGRDYPVIAVDMERNHLRRTLRARRQAAFRDSTPVDPLPLYDYLSAFMEINKLVPPYLEGTSSQKNENKPKFYEEFCGKYKNLKDEEQKRIKGEEEGSLEKNDGKEALSDRVKNSAEDTLKSVASEEPPRSQEQEGLLQENQT